MKTIKFTEAVNPTFLDSRLAHGYFRMQQTLFTTRTTTDNEGRAVKVLWVRARLENYLQPKKYTNLNKKYSSFNITLQDWCISDEIESLYKNYIVQVDFRNRASSVAHYLLNSSTENVFPTRMILVRDEGKLIAAGYFDQGHESVSAILNFYDPDYKHLSPGLWLYFKCASIAACAGVKYYYPGYVALGYPKYDYKLQFDKDIIELWEPETNSWVHYKELWLSQQYLPA